MTDARLVLEESSKDLCPGFVIFLEKSNTRGNWEEWNPWKTILKELGQLSSWCSCEDNFLSFHREGTLLSRTSEVSLGRRTRQRDRTARARPPTDAKGGRLTKTHEVLDWSNFMGLSPREKALGTFHEERKRNTTIVPRMCSAQITTLHTNPPNPPS